MSALRHVDADLHDLGGEVCGEVCGEEWMAIRPTASGDETCDDLLRMIEKGQRVPALLDHLAHCRAPLPDLHCEMLGLAAGSTCADAVQALRSA